MSNYLYRLNTYVHRNPRPAPDKSGLCMKPVHAHELHKWQ